VCISHETVLLGTGGALRFFENFLTDTFCIHSGDVMTDADISDIIAFHERHEPMITLALIKNANTNYIRIDRDNTVVDIAAVPQPNASDYYTFSGISIFSKQVFSYLPDRDVFGMIEIFHAVQRNKGIITGYPCTMTWYNVNSSTTYWELNRDILNGNVQFNGIDVAEPHYIDPSSTVKADDIRGFVSIGARCVIERGVTLENTIVFDDTHITQGTYRNCIASDAFCVRVQQ
jgi:NDP-sugar pyrophosphorylase family protein